MKGRSSHIRRQEPLGHPISAITHTMQNQDLASSLNEPPKSEPIDATIRQYDRRTPATVKRTSELRPRPNFFTAQRALRKRLPRLLNLLPVCLRPNPHPAKRLAQARPSSVSSYSTFGGITGCTVRVTSPSRSICRTVWVSIFWLMPPTSSPRRVKRTAHAPPTPRAPASSTCRRRAR